MSRANRLPYAILSGITFFALAIWLLGGPSALSSAPLATRHGALIGIVGVGLYLGSHILRAIRLAVIGVYIHKTSFRTLALLNLSVAPWSMIAPFKLDELIRLNELRTINGSLAKALITIVVDRSVDGPMFVVFAAILALSGMSGFAVVVGLVGVVMIAVTIGFFAASGILGFVQNYIFLHHNKARALQTLQIVDNLRRLASLGRATIKNTLPILLVCTLGIWLLEIGAVAMLLSVASPLETSLPAALSATLERANSGWRALLLGEQSGLPVAMITYSFLAGLLIIWPFTIWLYVKRRFLEVRNAEFLGRDWGRV